MRSKRKWRLVAGVLLVIGVLAYAFMPGAVPIETAVVTRGPLEVAVRDDGRTRIKERYIVSAPLAGQLQRIQWKPGHSVKPGMILAVIEPTAPELLDPRARAGAEARVNAAGEARQQAQAILERANAALEYATNELKRVHELFQSRTVSIQELDRAELAERTAEGDLNSARFGLRIAEYELELAQTALMRSKPGAGEDGWRIEIRAPVAGKVLRVYQESTAVVTPGMPLLEVGDPENLEIEIDVLSSDAVKIRPGGKVLLEHWGGPKPLEARVRLVEPAGFLKISALGVEEQRVWVIADFAGPRAEWENLGDAYRVEARIVTWESTNALKVAAGATFRQGEQWAVFQADGGRARLRPVEVGQQGEHEVEVLRGLSEGTRVILHPSDKISDSTRVKARQ
jgi:HlyD family secretion protein